MKRYTVLVMLLTFSMWAMAQTTQTDTNSAPSNPQTVTVPGAVNTSTGTAVIVAPRSAPLVVTPEVHLSTVNPSVGASNATPGNTAGAANATAALPVTPRIITTAPQFSTAGASVTQTVPPPENAVSSFGATNLGTNAAGTPIVIVGNNNKRFDRGVGSGSALVAGGDNSGGRSMGEIARENRQQAAGANAHVYTNQDIQRINSQPGVTVGGISGAAVGAGNATQQEPSGNMPVVSQPSTNAPQTPGVSQPVPNKPPDQSQANPQMQEQRQMAQANPPANPADQSAQATGTQGSSGRQLPSSGSILPLMAVVGVLAAGAGLLSR